MTDRATVMNGSDTSGPLLATALAEAATRNSQQLREITDPAAPAIPPARVVLRGS